MDSSAGLSVRPELSSCTDSSGFILLHSCVLVMPQAENGLGSSHGGLTTWLIALQHMRIAAMKGSNKKASIFYSKKKSYNNMHSFLKVCIHSTQVIAKNS